MNWFQLPFDEFARKTRCQVASKPMFGASDMVRQWQRHASRKTYFLFISKGNLEPCKGGPDSVCFRGDDSRLVKREAYMFIYSEAEKLGLYDEAITEKHITEKVLFSINTFKSFYK